MAIQSLKNKKIVISAGASGIGLATAKVCLDRGATVFVCDIDEKLIYTVVHKIKAMLNWNQILHKVQIR